MAYSAIITRIKTSVHPNADKIQLGEVAGHQVIVGLDTKNGALGIFFPCDGQLSEKFAIANDLVTRVNRDGSRGGGYFGNKRRVKAQNFRGEKSEGFWCPLTYLRTMFIYLVEELEKGQRAVDDLKEGDMINEILGVEICRKYITPATAKAARNANGSIKKTNRLFPKHIDTDQFKYKISHIQTGATIWFTEKLHGTSARMAYVPETYPVTGLKKYFNKLWNVFKPVVRYEKMHGSRNVILNDCDNKDYYYQDNFRQLVFDGIKDQMNKNEIIYGEIVGQTTSGGNIMSGVSFNKIQDKTLRKELKRDFGDTSTYYYGAPGGVFDFYVYRIAIINEDGDQHELSWPQVKRRCKELDVYHVPELSNWAQEYGIKGLEQDPDIALNTLKQLVAYMAGNKNQSRMSSIDEKTLREGVVLRVDQPDGTTMWLKDKSFIFKVLEGIAKEDESYIDTEESN